MTSIYYHIAGTQYVAGDALLCWDRLIDSGVAVEWKWDDADEGFDGDVVCLFSDLAEAEEFFSEHGGTLLTITVPEEIQDQYETPYGDYIQPRLTAVSEGYVAVFDGIPVEWISR